MATLRRISYRNQITLPPSVLREAGVGYGSLVEIEARDGKIILEPKEVKEKGLSPEDWDAMDRLVRKQVVARGFKEYANPKEAKKHFKRPGK